MKIYHNLALNNENNLKTVSYESTKNNSSKNNSITDLKNMPNYRYQVSFGAMNSNLENLYKAFGNGKGMPETYNKVLSGMSDSARESITSVYAHYRSVYAPLEECHSTETIKELFPTEFKNIQSALTRKSNNGSFISKMSQWGNLFQGESNKFLFPETKDNDLSVYLAKKLFLEAKTKNEIKSDFFKDINKEILSGKDIQELVTTTRGTEAIPDSVFAQLGLQGKFEANGFRNSLMRSREDFIQKYGSVYHSKRKANFGKTVEAVTSVNNTQIVVLPQRGSANYEKFQYAMFDVWNNSMNLRVAMSEFLTGKKAVEEVLMPDLMSIHTLKIQKDKTQVQKDLMREFWSKNPALREEFSDRCKESFDKVENAIDSGRFEELKREIDTQRQNTFVEMKALKEERERKILEQKRLAEEKIRIENLNNAIRKDIRAQVNEIREYIPIPQREIPNTAEYFSKTVKNGKSPDSFTIRLLSVGLKTATEAASKTSFTDIITQKGIQKNVDPYYKGIISDLCERGYNQGSDEIMAQIFKDKCLDEIDVLENVYEKYILYVCNNNSAHPKVKVRKQEMEKIINTLLQDDSVSEKLKLPSQRKLLRAQAAKIAEIPIQDVENVYTGHYSKALKKLSEIDI